MSRNHWGPIVWTFFHTLSFKIKDDCFNDQKIELLNIFKLIITNLPCPFCSRDAQFLFNQCNLRYIVDKDSFIDFIYNFHNKVNLKLRKSIYKKEDLEKYNNMNFNQVILELINLYSKKSSNIRLMMLSKNNKTIVDKLNKYFMENQKYFNC